LTAIQRTQFRSTSEHRLSQTALFSNPQLSFFNTSILTSPKLFSATNDISSISTTSPSIFASIPSTGEFQASIVLPTIPEPLISTSQRDPTTPLSIPEVQLDVMSDILPSTGRESLTVVSHTPTRTIRHYRPRQPQLPLACRPLIPGKSYHHYLERCDVVCSKCGAVHWKMEQSSYSTKNNTKFEMCCRDGKISLAPLNDAPIAIHELLTNETSHHTFHSTLLSSNT
jgi:hypothetical protein